MGIAGEVAEEGMVKGICYLLTEKIKEYSGNPETVAALKEVGIWALNQLMAIPDWAREYYQMFRE